MLLELKAAIDISFWWPRDGSGKPLSVYAVHKDIEDNDPENLITRHTLTRARDGQLEKGDFANAVKLARVCSRWSGQTITVHDLIKVQDD